MKGLREQGSLSFIEDIADVSELEVVGCESEPTPFVTSLNVEIFGNFRNLKRKERKGFLEDFILAYNDLAETYCDPLFRRISSIEIIAIELLEDIEDESRIRFDLLIEGTCRGCTDGDAIVVEDADVDDRRRLLSATWDGQPRRLEAQEVCLCPRETIEDRAPSDDEFFLYFRDFVEDAGFSSIASLAQVGNDANFVETFDPSTLDPSFFNTIYPSFPDSTLDPSSTFDPSDEGSSTIDPSDEGSSTFDPSDEGSSTFDPSDEGSSTFDPSEEDGTEDPFFEDPLDETEPPEDPFFEDPLFDETEPPEDPFFEDPFFDDPLDTEEILEDPFFDEPLETDPPFRQ